MADGTWKSVFMTTPIKVNPKVNSLRDHIDDIYVAGSILLEKDDACSKALLLVEGQDDEYVFRKLVCCANAK